MFGFGQNGNSLLGGGAVAAHQQILNSVRALDANASVYDPDNENTWTLRESGGSQFYTQVSDGMGNREALAQATEAAQPEQKTLSTGRRVFDAPTATKFMLADFASNIAQPNTVLAVHRLANTTQTGTSITDSFGAAGGRQQFSTGTSGTPVVYRMFAGTILDRGASDTNWNTAQTNFDGASGALFLNGSQVGAAGDVGANALGGLGILATASGSGEIIASLGLVVVFSGLKTNAETASLRAKINSLYPIGVSE